MDPKRDTSALTTRKDDVVDKTTKICGGGVHLGAPIGSQLSKALERRASSPNHRTYEEWESTTDEELVRECVKLYPLMWKHWPDLMSSISHGPRLDARQYCQGLRQGNRRSFVNRVFLMKEILSIYPRPQEEQERWGNGDTNPLILGFKEATTRFKSNALGTLNRINRESRRLRAALPSMPGRVPVIPPLKMIP